MNTVYTIGHGTRKTETFIRILQSHKIKMLVDVRTIAASRHNPQYNEEYLHGSLAGAGIGYVHCQGLGGLRHTTKDSVNTAWHNASFRGYADYMQTAEFQEKIEQLVDIARHKRTAIMCAETVPWRCHRSLIGDALLIRDVAVVDIMSEKTTMTHNLTPFAAVRGLTITYPQTDGTGQGR